MPLENAKSIAELDSNWPLGSDSATRGDDHLRLIKAVLKAQFPGPSGQGFTKPITISEDLLNSLQDKLDITAEAIKAMFPVGTVVFRMDAINPGSIYGGTWRLIQADASITFGNGGTQNLNPVGENEPVVNLPEHNHHATSDPAGSHSHAITNGDSKTDGDDGSVMQGGPFLVGRWTHQGYNLGYLLKGSNNPPTGGATSTASDHNHPVRIGNAGVPGAKMNVRGARVALNVWYRVS